MSTNVKADEVRCLSLNVMADLRAHAGFERWAERRAVCGQALRQANADLIGLQECVLVQQSDLLALLPEYDAVTSDLSGTDSALCDEFRARTGFELPLTGELQTLYRRDAFEYLERREAWMSPTPDRISTGFGQRLPRSLLGLRLRHRASALELWVVNSRLEYQCTEPMASVAVRVLADWIGPLPAIWLGDFNAGLASATGQIIRNGGWLAPSMRPDAHRGERTEHIWRRGPGLELIDCQVIDSAAFTPALSDHDGLLARFEIAPFGKSGLPNSM